MLTLGLIVLAIFVGIGALTYAASYFLLSGGKSEEQIRNKYQGSSESQSVFVKKYAEADLSKLRSFLLAAGSVVAFSTSIYALSWTDKPEQVVEIEQDTLGDELAIEAPPTEQIKTPPPPPPPPVVEIVEDDEIIEDAPKFEANEAKPDDTNPMDNTPTKPEKDDEKKPDDEPDFFLQVEEMPKFKGCEKLTGDEANKCRETKIKEYISKNLVYPQMAQENDIEGKIHVRFIVNELGDVTEVSVMKPVDKILDKAAIDLVKSFPKFTPGKQRGKAVKVAFVIPINFTLQ
jgi:protein TonB